MKADTYKIKKGDSEVVRYLKQVRALRLTAIRSHAFSIEEFILTHGLSFQPKRLPEKYRRGEMKMCFYNSFMLSLQHPELTYCEGYALGIIPCHHAWCVDEKGMVVDSTWKDGSQYFGVPILREYTQACFVKRSAGCVLDDWQNNWPILKEKPGNFLAKIGSLK